MGSTPKASPIAITIFKLSVLIFGSLSLVGLTFAALNFTFLRRVLSYPENPITNVDWYKPLQPVAGGNSQLSTATSSLIDPASLTAVAKYAQEQNSSALLVMHQGQLVLEKYWQGHSISSTSNAMSMSKTIVALLIGIAIEEGHLKSELEPVSQYIREWSHDQRQQITLQDLLYMHSGLANKDNINNPGSDLVRMYVGKDADEVALQIPAIEPPRQTFNYNNANTQLLSEVLERATGEKYADYLSSRLWQPLGASEASLWLDRPNGNPKPFCCFFATARDWAKVGQMFLDRGQVNGVPIVSPAWIEKMIRPSPLEASYGYHLWVKARDQKKPNLYTSASEPFLAEDTIYLDGRDRQLVYIIPSFDLVIVRVGEKPTQWDDAWIPNRLIRNLKSSYSERRFSN